MTLGLTGLEVPATWVWRPLKHATRSVSRGTAPNYVDDGPVWAVSQAANQPQGLDWLRARFHDYRGDLARLKGHLQTGDVLINSTGRGTLGRVGYFESSPDDRPAMADGHVTRVRALPGVLEPRFAYYYLSSDPFQRYLHSALVVGATNQIELVGERLERAPIVLPPLAEQQRMVQHLDAATGQIDKVLSARARVQQLLALKRERVIEHLLNTEADRRDFVPLKHLADSVTVGIVVTPASWYVERGGVPALRGLNVKPGSIDVKNLVQISREGHLIHNKSRLRSGDIVVVRTGQAGAAAVVTPDLDGANCIDLVIVRPSPSLEPKFVEYLLNSDYARSRVREFSVGSIQAHFNVTAMKAMPVPRYALEEQQRIVAEIDRALAPIDEALSQMRRQECLLVERRQALVTAAFTGKIAS
ncbi:restriction endonuclease subunit S [Micromonospora echinofusca]|uniref:restriction endonuclease subunit S n=1 Tax=Micromonospora echinofusca TaxID=47858 RepID=UPI0033FBEE60